MKRSLFTLAGVLAAAHPVHAALLLNEVHLNPPNASGLGDRNFEYIELRSTTNGTESTNGLTLIIVNNDRWDMKDDVNGNEVATKLNLGKVEEAWSLDDMKTGTNGLLLLGDKYTELPKGGPWAGFIDPATEVGDPLGMGDGNIGPNDGLSIFLVSGFTNPPPNAGTVQDPEVDFDVDDNGVLDWLQTPVPAGGIATAPFTILDQIGTRDRNADAWPTPPAPVGVSGIAEPYTGSQNGANANLHLFASSGSFSLGNRDPDSFSRNAGNLAAGTASAWYGGKYPDPAAGSDPANSIPYRADRTFGLANGIATPGRANLSSSLPAADFRINEVNLDPSNDRFQCIEIVNVNGTSAPGSRSLAGFWLVLVDSNVSVADQDAGVLNKVGTVIEEWDLSAMATGNNGLLMIADDAASSYTAFEDYVPAETGKGDPIARDTAPKSTGFGAGDIGSKSGFSLFLIRNYKMGTTADTNLAPGRDVDTNEDGILDANAFASAGNLNVTVVDSVGFDMATPLAGGAGKTYATVNLRTVFPTFTVSDGNKACDNFSRKVDGSNLPVATNAATSWYGGEFPPSAGFNLGFMPPQADQVTAGSNPTGTTHFGGYRGAATPGRPNLGAAINSASPPIPAEIRLSEVMIDPTDVTTDPNPNNHDLDQNRDYIELLSSNRGLAYLDGYWLVVVDNAGNNKGVIKTGAPLDGQTTGLNGLLLVGDNYDTPTSIPYISAEGTLPPATATVDPVVAFGGDDIPGNGATILLIRGPSFDLVTTPNGPFKTGGPVTLTNLKPTGDIDPDNDGVLQLPADWLAPGAVIVDALSTGTVDPGPGYGYISGGTWRPDCAARYPGDIRASTPAAWYFGEVDQTTNPTLPSTSFSNFVGTFHGHASPGRWNHAAAVGPITPGSVLLSEVHFNPAGSDANFEFIELLDKLGAGRSLNGYALVMIDNVKPNTGTIQRAWELDGCFTGSNGLAVITNGTAVTSPWAPQFPAQTSVTDLPGRDDLITGFGDGTIATESDNQSVMLLLVRNFNSFVGADLDILAGAVESPGDGIIDNAVAAWDGGTVHDSIVLRSWLPAVTGQNPQPAQWNGFTYSLADLSGTFFPNPDTLFYHPETVARFRGNVTANSAGAWYGGDLVGGPSGKLGTDTTYVTNDPTHPPVPAGFTGQTTPGQPNLTSGPSSGYDAWAAAYPGIGAPTADADNDTYSNLLEYAAGSIPNNTASIPQSAQTRNGNTLTTTWTKGAQAAADSNLTWTIEASTSLTAGSWSTAGVVNVQNGTANISGDYLIVPGTPKAFLRLKVVRTP